MYMAIMQAFRNGRAYPGSELVVANTLAKWKKLESNETNFSQSFSQKVYPTKKRNAPLRTVQLSRKSQVIGQFSLYQCKGMSVTDASHVFCNQVSKLC